MCRARKFDLLRAIKTKFGANPYKVSSSPMIRAQQTAYYMLLENTDKRLNIVPHIGEYTAPPQDDNVPLPPADQVAYLGPDIVGKYENDERGSRGALAHTPSDKMNPSAQTYRSTYESFVTWIQLLQDARHVGNFFPRNPAEPASDSSIRRAVLFTHSGFLYRAFGIRTQNNDIIYVTLNPSSDEIFTETVLLSTYDLDPGKRVLTNGCGRVPVGGGKKLKSRRRHRGKSPGKSTRKYGRH